MGAKFSAESEDLKSRSSKGLLFSLVQMSKSSLLFSRLEEQEEKDQGHKLARLSIYRSFCHPRTAFAGLHDPALVLLPCRQKYSRRRATLATIQHLRHASFKGLPRPRPRPAISLSVGLSGRSSYWGGSV